MDNASEISIVIDDADSGSGSSNSLPVVVVKNHHSSLHANLSRQSNKTRSSLSQTITVNDQILAASELSLNSLNDDGDIDSLMDQSSTVAQSHKQSPVKQRPDGSAEALQALRDIFSASPEDFGVMRRRTASQDNQSDSELYLADARIAIKRQLTLPEFNQLVVTVVDSQKPRNLVEMYSDSQRLLQHPILSLYLLMFLIERDMQQLYFFVKDVAEFEQSYHKSQAHHRHTLANKIFNAYLSPKGSLNILRCLPKFSVEDSDNLDAMVKHVQSMLKVPEVHIFGDFLILVHKVLAMRFGNNKQDKLDVFVKSAQYQCMKTDLNEEKLLTAGHVTRVIQRVLDLPQSLLHSFHQKLTLYLDNLCFDWKSFTKSSNALPSKEKKSFGGSSFNMAQIKGSFNNLTANKSTNTLPSDSPTMKRVDNEPSESLSHPFVLSRVKQSQFCESCFMDTSVDNADARPYTCELCNYVVHASCKQHVGIECFAVSKNLDDLYDINIPIVSRIKSAADRYYALQQSIEQPQRQSPVERSTSFGTKLKAESPKLPHAGQQERKKQFLQAEASTVMGVFVHLCSQVPKDQFESLVSQVPKQLQEKLEDMPNSAAIKVQVPESILPSNNTLKSIVIGYGQTVKDVLKDLVVKIGLKQSSSDFTLQYEGGQLERQMSDNDRPIVVYHLLENVHFTLVVKKKLSDYDSVIALPIVATADDKRKSIINEIIDTEQKFTDNLTMAITQIYDPILQGGIVPRLVLNGIFGNLQEIEQLHRSAIVGMKSSVVDSLIQAFSDVKFGAAYGKYCGNQHDSRRALGKITKESPEFAKQLKDLEQKTGQKLALADILIQPMHRITRYPILLKRLIQATPAGHEEFQKLQQCLISCESITQQVNNVVMVNESYFRMDYIQANMDWQEHEVILLRQDSRQLVSEKPLLLNTKKGDVEVLVLEFSDLVLLVQVSKKDTYTLIRPPIYIQQSYTILNIGSLVEYPKNSFQLVHVGNQAHTLTAMSNTDRLIWLSSNANTRMAIKPLVRHLQTTLTMTGVISQLLQEFVPKSKPRHRSNSYVPPVVPTIDDTASVNSGDSQEHKNDYKSGIGSKLSPQKNSLLDYIGGKLSRSPSMNIKKSAQQ